ncbi:MAG: ABC transporter permease, partial [Acutalibacteraceae bacterium]
EEKLSEYQSAEAQTESEISKAREELGDIPFPVWNVSDRTGYSTYNDFDNDSSSIKNLSVLFPTVFFVVAVLISLITMNRMIEEDRVLLGTLKSLGFSNGRIMFRYLFFSLAATVSGGIAGAALGVCIIPSIIWNIYNILFDIPGFRLGFNLIYTAAGLLISIICICGTSLYTVKKELRSKPAELLRPKAPKNGKRVFLEKIGFVWKRLNFSHKVTVRNLFRYKKRAVTTVVGITGCTALILSGFGLRDSITDIPTVHFGEVFIYDDMVYVDSSADKARLDAAFEDSRIMSRTDCHLLSCKSGDYDVTVFVPDSADEIQNAVSLKELETGQTVDLPDSGVIITDKLSSLTGLKAGDKIAVSDSVGTACEFNISAVVQNYIGHYVFMTKQCYENSFGEYSTNVVYLKTVQNEPQEQSGFVSELLKSEAVFSVSDAAGLKGDVDNMLKSLNSVVLILIILSSLLSFTVLYNLSNININERKREIATLKVLGFYHREVDRYITRETVILTAA